MISACADLPQIDDMARAYLRQECERQKTTLTPLRVKAWRLILYAKRKSPADNFDNNWYVAMPLIKRGTIDFEIRRMVGEILRPRLKISKPFAWFSENRNENSDETLHDLLYVDFEARDHPGPSAILSDWPSSLTHRKSLFETLMRVLGEALDEASDVGWDRASRDVPSIAPHAQNQHRTRFYPIVATLAGLWLQIGDENPEEGRSLALTWKSRHTLLLKRLSLFAHNHSLFTPTEAATCVLELDDEAFWISDAQVEIMKLLLRRWNEFSDEDRNAIEERLRGVPPELYGDAYEDNEEWRSIFESKIFRRLNRLKNAGCDLGEDASALLEDITLKHPDWRAGPSDRDDFSSWAESRWGLDGHPDRLAEVEDERLVEEAIRLQNESRYDEGDLWRKFCSADPLRALRGLKTQADKNSWDENAWRSMIFAAAAGSDDDLQFGLAQLVLEMPNDPFEELLPAVTDWLRQKRKAFFPPDKDQSQLFFALWDRAAKLVFAPSTATEDIYGDRDILFDALNSSGGSLAQALLDAFSAPDPAENDDFPPEFKPRFDLLIHAQNHEGLLARVFLARFIPYLFASASNWTKNHLLPLLDWNHKEANVLWRSYPLGPGLGKAELFNILKPNMLMALERNDMPEEVTHNLMARLLSVALAHKRLEAEDYVVTSDEIKRALVLGSTDLRQNVAWNLWRIMGAKDGQPPDKTTRWRDVVGPIFAEIWPLDAKYREVETTRNLVYMALDSEQAFPQVVDAILDFLVPFEMYQISHILRLESHHGDLVALYPRIFLKLAGALIDARQFSVPSDLGTLLQDCLAADPTISKDANYIRLNGLRRLGDA